MIKSPTFIALFTYIILSIARIEVSSRDVQSQDNAEEPPPIILSCVLFKDTGCDSECFLMTEAYGKLGAGACIQGNICVCNYAIDPSLDSLWSEKFHSSENILQQFKANAELSHIAYTILADPFTTGLQMKERFKRYLSQDQYHQLRVIDTNPAMKMNPTIDRIDPTVIKTYVDKKLPDLIKLSNKELSAIDYEIALKKALDDAKHSDNHFKQLVREVRRVQNESLNRILANYMKENNIQQGSAKNDDDEDTVFSVLGVISNEIINELIKRVERTALENIWNWLGEKLISIFTSRELASGESNNKVDKYGIDQDPDRFKLPPEVDRNPFKKSNAMNRTWKGDKFTLRYRRGEKGDINLSWIKKQALMVSILKTAGSDVNQNWIFRDVRINMSRTVDGKISQMWDFGTYSYEYFKILGPGGHIVENWSNGKADEQSLKIYKAHIESWCKDNNFLIDQNNCIIYT